MNFFSISTCRFGGWGAEGGEVLEWLCTVGGGGQTPPPPLDPPYQRWGSDVSERPCTGGTGAQGVFIGGAVFPFSFQWTLLFGPQKECRPPTAVGYPPSAVGCPSSAVQLCAKMMGWRLDGPIFFFWNCNLIIFFSIFFSIKTKSRSCPRAHPYQTPPAGPVSVPHRSVPSVRVSASYADSDAGLRPPAAVVPPAPFPPSDVGSALSPVPPSDTGAGCVHCPAHEALCVGGGHV